MQSGNNIHVQQHKTNMINEEWNKTQNDAPFVAFYDMSAVTFVLPDEMANVSITELQWFILIPRLNHTGSHRPIDSHSIPYLHREKNIGFGTRTTQPAAILRITRKAAPRKRPNENIVGKEENTGNKQFLLFLHSFFLSFLPYEGQTALLEPHLNCGLQILPTWTFTDPKKKTA